MNECSFKITTTFIIKFIGIPGNFMIIYIYTRENFRKVPMFRYFIVSTLFETINLLLYWPLISSSINSNSLFCKLSQYLSYLVSLNISWIGVLVSIDRYLSIKYPYKFKFRSEFIYQMIFIISILIISILINIPIAHYYSSYNNTCDIKDEEISLKINIIDLLVSTVIPFIIMILSSALIGSYLIKNKMKFKDKTLDKEKQLIKILFSMDIFFFICYSPYSVYAILEAKNNIDDSSKSYYEKLYLFVNFVLLIYCSFGFFMHLICNIQFRKYFFTMVGVNKETDRKEIQHENTVL